ncbi:MAG: fluoride efflux transporter CrcB [Gammaproteobacteria bacterium]
MTQLISIAFGGAIGAVLRFSTSNMIYSQFGRTFPWGTLMVNVTGSLFMGLLFVLFTERMELNSDLRAFITVGLLGAFTTFSTFSIETMNLIESGELTRAGVNILASVVCCLAACWLGMIIARQL